MEPRSAMGNLKKIFDFSPRSSGTDSSVNVANKFGLKTISTPTKDATTRSPQCHISTVKPADLNKLLLPTQQILKCHVTGCRFVSVKNELLQAHISKSHGEKPGFKEPIVSQARISKVKPSDVKKLLTSSPIFKCHVQNCRFVSSQNEHLQTHLVLIHSEKPAEKPPEPDVKPVSIFKCHVKDCRFVSSKNEQLQTHMSENHAEKPAKKSPDAKQKNIYKCEVKGCRFVSKFQSVLSVHVAKHEEKVSEKNPKKAKQKRVPSVKTKKGIKISKKRPRRKAAGPKSPVGTVRLKNIKELLPDVFKCQVSGCRFAASKISQLPSHMLDVHGEKAAQDSGFIQCRLASGVSEEDTQDAGTKFIECRMKDTSDSDEDLDLKQLRDAVSRRNEENSSDDDLGTKSRRSMNSLSDKEPKKLRKARAKSRRAVETSSDEDDLRETEIGRSMESSPDKYRKKLRKTVAKSRPVDDSSSHDDVDIRETETGRSMENSSQLRKTGAKARWVLDSSSDEDVDLLQAKKARAESRSPVNSLCDDGLDFAPHEDSEPELIPEDVKPEFKPRKSKKGKENAANTSQEAGEVTVGFLNDSSCDEGLDFIPDNDSDPEFKPSQDIKPVLKPRKSRKAKEEAGSRLMDLFNDTSCNVGLEIVLNDGSEPESKPCVDIKPKLKPRKPKKAKAGARTKPKKSAEKAKAYFFKDRYSKPIIQSRTFPAKSVKACLAPVKQIFRCKVKGCRFAALNGGLLRSHVSKAHGKNQALFMSCEHCQFTTKNKPLLVTHIVNKHIRPNQVVINFMKNIFRCSDTDCDFKTVVKNKLAKHRWKVHGDMENVKICSICEYKTVGEGLFERHSKKHLRQKGVIKHDCEVPDCDFSCAQMATLRAHLVKIHGRTELLKRCSQCEFSTTYTHDMKRHLEKHTPGKKSFQCNYPGCDYSSSRKAQLNVHLHKEHQEAKDLKQCCYCDYNTVLGFRLNRHMNEKHLKAALKCPYDTCSYTTTRKTYINTHLAKQHGFGAEGVEEKSLHCSVYKCKYSTSRQELLDAHWKKKHGPTSEPKNTVPALPVYNPPVPILTNPYYQNTYSITPTGEEKEKILNCSYYKCLYSTVRQDLLDAHWIKKHGPNAESKADVAPVTAYDLQAHYIPNSTYYPYNTYSGYGYGYPQAPDPNAYVPQNYGETERSMSDDGIDFEGPVENDYPEPYADYSVTQPPETSEKQPKESKKSSTVSVGALKQLVSGKRKKYICTFTGCTYIAHRKMDLTAHVTKEHPASRTLIGPRQDCSVLSTEDYKKKIQETVKLEMYKCYQMGCTFKAVKQVELTEHMASMHKATAADSAPQRKTATVSTDDFRRRLLEKKSGNVKKTFNCYYEGCTFSGTARTPLMTHLRHAHGEAQSVKSCPHCDYSTFQTYDLKRHIEKHLPGTKRTFQCDYTGCDYSCTRRTQLKSHLQVKHGEAKDALQCPHCEYSTALPSRLKRHINEKHFKVQTALRCPFTSCDFTAPRKSHLNAHVAKHHHSHG